MPYTANRITAVLVVTTVEPSLAFWEQRLGFTRTVAIPDQGPLAFAILQRDGTEVMLSSEEAARADLPQPDAVVIGTSTNLFIEVTDLDDIVARLGGYPIAMPRRTTFYGMVEIGVIEPGGHWVTFAQPSSTGEGAK